MNLLATALVLAASFLGITREEAAREMPVAVTGVVTTVAYWQWHSFILAPVDRPNGPGVYVAGEVPSGTASVLHKVALDYPEDLREGDVVAVSGRTARLLFAPGLTAAKVTRLGAVDHLPAAPSALPENFRGGRLDNCRVTVRGVVQEVAPVKRNDMPATELILDVAGMKLRTVVKGELKMADYLDAEVQATGLVMSEVNARAEFIRPRLEVSSSEEIQVLVHPKMPFEAPLVPDEGVLAWNGKSYNGHRVRVVGTLTRGSGTVVYLQNGERALRVELEQATDLKPGRYEASGFAEMEGMAGRLTGAVIRALPDAAQPIAPYPFKADEAERLSLRSDFSYNDLEGRLVSLDIRYLRDEPKKGGGTLYGILGKKVVAVDYSGELSSEVRQVLDEEPLLRVVGICRLNLTRMESSRIPMYVEGVRLELCRAGDITFIPDGAWLERHHERLTRQIVWAVIVALVVLVGVLIVRLVRLASQKKAMGLISEERRRMAADLHDTIEQYFASSRILLSSALRVKDGMAPKAQKAVEMAANVLADAKTQVRTAVMNLRADPKAPTNPAAALRQLAHRLNAVGAVRARVALRGLPERMEAAPFADLMALVNEAVTNAMKHGHARNIVFAADPGGRLRILNDGEHFDPAKALGPEAGHFGLSGMRERAKRSGFGFSIGQKDRWMYVEATL